MEIQDNIIKALLGGDTVRTNHTDSHYICTCPYCLKEKHFYVQRKTNRTDRFGMNASWSWTCKRCGESGRLTKLLIKLDRKDLLTMNGSVVDNQFKINKIKPIVIEQHFQSEIHLPIGFSRIYSDEYLNSRGWVNENYHTIPVGVSSTLRKFENRIIFLVYQNNLLKGWVARSLLTKQQLNDINDQRKIEGKGKVLRYENSQSNFSLLLLGEDELDQFTETVIIVEGVTDKANIDRCLNLFDEDSKVKCVASFGKKLSVEQLQIIKDKAPNCKMCLLWYDPDAVSDMKKMSGMFGSIDVRVCYHEMLDPGDLSREQIINISGNSRSVINFYTGILSIKKL